MLNSLYPFSSSNDTANSYEDWVEMAQRYDDRNGRSTWRKQEKSPIYDYRSIRRRLDLLTELRESGDDSELLFVLNEGIHGNMDGIANEALWQESQFGTKLLIHDYIDAVTDALGYLANPSVTSISQEEKLDFFNRASHCYGTSSLLFSGAGSYLYFHIGVAATLLSQGLLPKIICGSSAGAAVGAVLCCYSEVTLRELLSKDGVLAALKGLNEAVQTRTDTHFSELIEAMIPDLTFQQAFELTGRHLNVSIAPAEKHQNGRLLNAMTSPNVCIREAVMASCAMPGLLPPVTLKARDHSGERVAYLPNRQWVDGSLADDIPTKRLSRLYGVNHHIVSQANPLVTPFSIQNKEAQNPFEAIQLAMGASARTWLNLQMHFMETSFAMWSPQLLEFTSLWHSVINQDYFGDINIVKPPLYWSVDKLLSRPSDAEIEKLIDMGARATWPKVEMIRVQTQVSRELENILEYYEGFRQDTTLHKKPAIVERAKRQPY